METAQRISLYGYFHLKLTKPLHFSFYLVCFFFNKIRGQEGGTGFAQRRGEGARGRWPK
jgi:hypothetical protein